MKVMKGVFKKLLLLSVFCIFCISCADRKSAYQLKENKDDKNYHAKTAGKIINKAQSNKKKHDKKADKKRTEDIKNATKANASGKTKKAIKNPGPFNFY